MSGLKSAWELSLEKSEKLVPELKNKKYSFNTSVILCPFIAFFGFIPLALTLSATKMYFPLFKF